ncbi:DUF5696 domain-containing protein [Paenibacillus montaniterrae]|uniref:DUF5696 domain-containing protein n=1 Tax=Paenibacillus montaniterrae TaxID=429341 RepID=UPI001BD178D1|nr:DUF5696 domain-containing protein [Paenibacillus montaniterrae]
MKVSNMKWKRLLTVMLLVVVLLSQSSALHSLSGIYAERADEQGAEAEAAAAEQQASGAEGAEASAADTEAEAAGGAAAGAGAVAGAAGAEGEVTLSDITATKQVLRNEQFTLYLDEKTGNVRVVSNKTGTEWLGAPQVPSTLPPNNKKFVDSPLHLRFTEGSDITTTYSLKDSTTATSYKVDGDRVVLDINFGAEGIALQMIYTLTERGLQLDIPFESIVESGTARLTSLEPLPFFNGALETDTGAMLIPDGSGALLHFRTNHEQYLKGYSEYIYGNDTTFLTQTHDMLDNGVKRANTVRESIALPVFGMYRNGIGSLAIVKDGQYEAKINATPAGIRAIPVYRSAVEFMYRKNDTIFIGNSGQIPYFQGQMIPGNRSAEYVLLEQKDANYVGMAKAYRDYLIKEQGVVPVADQTPNLSLKLFGGILREEIIGDTFIKMTTFKQAQDIISRLKASGVSNIVATYDGWTKNGVYGAQPQHKAARQLGGQKGLESLISFANEQNVPLYLKANYVKPFEQTGKYNERKDAVRGMDRELLVATLYWPSDRWSRNSFSFHYLKPEQALNKYVKKQVDDFADFGVDGVQLQYMGKLIYSDEDKASITDRSVAAGAWIESMQLMKDQVGSVAVEYGNAYALGIVDRIEDAPLYHSNYTYTDEAVPFYQLVLHGLVPYYAGPINLREDATVEWLKAIEYGALPSAELTGELSSKLHRTAATRLFSSYADDWIEPIAAEFQELQPMYEAIAGQQMMNHEQLAAGVFRTTYSNGTTVIVNYNNEDVTVDGITIKSLNYTWNKG